MSSHCKDHPKLSLLQAISHSEKAFLHVEKACDVISQGLTVLEQDCARILKTHVNTEMRGPFFWPEPSHRTTYALLWATNTTPELQRQWFPSSENLLAGGIDYLEHIRGLLVLSEGTRCE